VGCNVDNDPNTPLPVLTPPTPPGTPPTTPLKPGDEVPPLPDGTCPPGTNAGGTGGKTGVGRTFCTVDDDPNTPTPTPTGQTAPATTTTPGTTGTTTTLTTPTTPTNRGGGGSSSTFSTTIVNPATPPTTAAVSPEVSSCRVDGNANGFQQQFDTAKYSACGLYPTGQTAYTEGFTEGCMEAGNTNQMCSAFIQLNTGAQSTPTQTQAPTTTQPTQAIQPTQ
jgi:hypothetical protein